MSGVAYDIVNGNRNYSPHQGAHGEHLGHVVGPACGHLSHLPCGGHLAPPDHGDFEAHNVDPNDPLDCLAMSGPVGRSDLVGHLGPRVPVYFGTGDPMVLALAHLVAHASLG